MRKRDVTDIHSVGVRGNPELANGQRKARVGPHVGTSELDRVAVSEDEPAGACSAEYERGLVHNSEFCACFSSRFLGWTGWQLFVQLIFVFGANGSVAVVVVPVVMVPVVNA